MKIVEKKGNEITFTLKIENSLANAIRRYVNEIPILAVDEVEIFKNDSPLYDEALAHRLALIPIKTNSKKEGKLKLESKKEGFVYSGELKGDVDIVYDNIPITFLNKNQEISLLAIVKTGKGSEHSKFSPGIIFYREVMEITLEKSLKEKVKKMFPENEIKEKENKIILIDNKKKEILDVCDGICEKEKKKIETNPTGELIITIESFGQIPPKEIFVKSIKRLKEDLTEISKKL